MKSISKVIIIILLVILLYIQHSKNFLISQNSQLSNKLSYYEPYFKLHQEFQGKFIYEVFDLKKEIFEEFLKKNNIGQNFIFLRVDSLDCMSCLDFNIQNIRLLTKNKFRVVVNSELYKDMIKSEIKEAMVFENVMSQNQYFPSRKVGVFYLNPAGRIINFDVSDSNNFELTKFFYRLLNLL